MTISTQQIASLASGLDGELGTLANGLISELENVPLPILGTSLNGAIQDGQQALQKIQALQSALSGALQTLEDGFNHPAGDIVDAINGALADAGFAGSVQASVNSDDALTLSFANDATASFTSAIAGDLGLGFADFTATGTTEVNLDYRLRLNATVDASGDFSLNAPNGSALSLSLDASAPQFSTDSQLGYLEFSTQDTGSSLTSSFSLDASGAATESATANVSEQLTADLQNADFPSISAALQASWSLGQTPTIALNNVSINFGSFVEDFIIPLLDELDPILQPLHDLAAIVNTDITPLDRFASILDKAGAIDAHGNDAPDGKVTLVDLLKLADPSQNFTGIVQLANLVTEITDWAAFLTGKNFGPDQYNLGSFTIDPTTLATSVSASAQNLNSFLSGLSGGGYGASDASGQTGAAIVADIADNANFSFPILTNPLSALGVLLGQNVNLFNFNVGATFGFGSIAADGTPTSTVTLATLPLLAFPQISLTLSGALQAVVDIAGGYDTNGLQEYAQSGFSNTADLANGFFLSGGGQPLLQLSAAVEAGLSAGIIVASFTGGADVSGQLSVALANTLHLDQFPADLAQLFTTSGVVTAGFDAVATLGVAPFVWTPLNYHSPRITLASFASGLPGLSGSISGGGGGAGGASSVKTDFTVSSTAQLDADVASLDAGGANAQDDAFYTITIAAGANVAIDDAFPGFSLPSGASFEIVDNGQITFTASNFVSINAPIFGSGSIEVAGTGTLDLAAANDFSGGIQINSGTLELGSFGSDGLGDVTFGASAHATLSVDQGASPQGVIFGFDTTDTIALAGLALTSAVRDSSNVATLDGEGGVSAQLNFDPTQDLNGLATKPDAVSGTDVVLLQTNFTVSTTSDFDAALASINIGGANALGGTPFTIIIASGAKIAVDANFPSVSLPDGATLKVVDNGEIDFTNSATVTFPAKITGVGDVAIEGSGAAIFSVANAYSGGTTLDGGTLELGDPQAAGDDDILFQAGVKSLLKIDLGDAPANRIKGFTSGDTIDLLGVSAVTATPDINHVVTLKDASQVTLASLSFDPAQDISGQAFVAQDDGSGGTKLRLIRTNFDVATTADFNNALASIDIGGDNSAPSIPYTITIDAGATIDLGSGFPGVNLAALSTLAIVNKGTLALGSLADVDLAAKLSGAGEIDIKGAGELELPNAGLSTGNATLEAGTLKLDSATSAGSGEIIFAPGSHAILELAHGVTIGNTILDMFPGETIRLDAVKTKTALLGDDNLVTIEGPDGLGGLTPITTFNIDPAADYTDYAFKTKPDGATGDSIVKVIKTTFYVADTADWNAAVQEIDVNGDSAWEDTNYKLILTSDFTLTSDLEAFNLSSDDQVTIVGGNHTINGANKYSGLFDYNGKVIGANFNIVDAHAQGGAGGAGGAGGGGGAGMGGGLFVAANGDVTLSNVNFTSDTATGGGGGSAGGTYALATSTDAQGGAIYTTYAFAGGGGGGLGGAGGADGGGGGGIGNGARGGAGLIPGVAYSSIPQSYYGSSGILPQAPGLYYYNQLSSGTEAGSGGGDAGKAGGAGVLSVTSSGSDSDAFGIFGGGGGASLSYVSGYYDPYNNRFVAGFTASEAGNGGYGGGGGGGSYGGQYSTGGASGGFGGGGGGDIGATYTYYDSSTNRDYTSTIPVALGGFGAGAGGAGENATPVDLGNGVYGYAYSGGGGGGGAGLGGGVYVQSGGKLTLGDGSVSGGAVAGGGGGAGAAYLLGGPSVSAHGGSAGSAFGAGIFFEGANSAILAPALGSALTISDVIADEVGSIPYSGLTTDYPTHVASLDVKGPGTVVLSANNSYSGGTTLEAGTLALEAAGAGGTGQISLKGGTLDLAAANAFVGHRPLTGVLTANLPTSATIVAAANLPSANAATATDSVEQSLYFTVPVYGVASVEQFDAYFTKSGANSWDVAIFNHSALTVGQFPYSGGALGAATLQFDPTTGLLTPASAHSLALTIASGQQVSLDLSAMTQSAAPFSLSNQSIYLAGDNISFAQGSTATLQIEAGDAPSALLQNFLPSGSVNSQETIDLRGVGLATSAIIGAGNVAIVSGGTSAPVTLHFDPATDFAGYHLALSGDGAGGSNVDIALNTTAASGQDINDILKRIDVGGASSVANTHYTITLTGNINLAEQLDAVNLASGDSLTIVGGGHTLNGEGQYRGFLDYAGALDLQNLTIANALAVGGSGGAGGGGGGAGLGGGLFVASGASASLENVTFINDHAVGGDGASAGSYGGGGGGLGGQGGASGGGGGAGLGANGGDPYSFNSPGSGIMLGAAGGGSDPANSGASGAGGSNGGGGAGDGFASVGGGGGVGGLATGQGGFGGGGGSGAGVNAGAGGFGGGGGAVSGVGFAAGAGGFGGGGGGAPIGASAGAAGFGAGAGSVSSTGGGGGGGLGAGGAIFVESGGALTYASGSESGSVVSGGSGGYTSPFGQTPVQAGGGEALGGAIFLQGAATLVLKPAVDDHLLISSAIADPTGSGGIGANAGAASVHIEGLGGVTFAGANTYSGGTLIDAGAMLTLSLGGSVGIGGVADNGSLNIGDSGVYAFLGAVTGAGSIAIAAGKAVTLAFSGAAPTVAINGFTTGDAIDLKSVAYASGEHLGASGGVTQVLGIHDDVLASLDIIGATPSAYSLTHDSNNDLFISDGGVLQALNETAALALPNGALSSQAGAALAGDSGANGSTVQVESIANGSLGSPVYGDYGALDLQANGTYSYQLFNAPQTGTTEHDVFGYTVGDAQGHTANVTLDISVLAPTAPAAPTIQAIVGQPTIHSKVELIGVGIVGDTIALYADGGASSVGGGTVGSTGAFDITTNLSFTQGPHTFVAVQTGANSLTSQPSPGFNVDVASANVATCAQFLAGRATLDALADGFDIFDNAANVSANFDALNSDTHIDAIHLTDTGEPILTLTIAQALADTAAAHAINNAPFGIDIVDTQAHLAVLSAPSIAALAAEGVIELTSKDATVKYTFSQSAAIQAANLILKAPANDFARETFSNGSSFVYYFGPTDALTKQVSTKVDGTFDALYLAAPGVFSGVNYAQYDVGFSKVGVRISDTYYDPTGAVLGSQTFTGNGGWSMYLAGAIVKQRTVQNGGAFDVYHYSSPGTFSGVNYGAFDVSFTASGSRNGETYYDANGGVLASETVASNGGFTLYIGGVLAEQRTVNPDGTSEAAFTNVQGQTYSSYQNAFSKTGVQLLHSVDNLNGAGVTNILGAGLEFGSGGAINLIGGADDFFYAPHSTQTYTFFANAAQDIIDFAPHFGVATVKGFGAASASTDVLNLSSLFTNFTQAQAAMTPVNSGFDTLITDSVGDKLTLVGVVSTSLNAGRLGLAS